MKVTPAVLNLITSRHCDIIVVKKLFQSHISFTPSFYKQSLREV